MSSQVADEETPLLPQEQAKKIRTPLPWRQFSIILFLQLSEPFTSQVISPFAPQLIRDIGITHGDEAKVGYYVGLLHSLFFATQALTVLHWSRLSDHIGRKPVILTGLFGLSMSMYCFGLSRTFVGLVLSRSLNGALNGNIGVMKSLMVELTDSTNLPQAYAYMPIAWSTGATLGPLVGGLLSRPADRFPNVFGHLEFFKNYPYFLACFMPATYTAIAWIVTFVFLKETVPNPINPFRSLLSKKPIFNKRTPSTESTSTQSTLPVAKSQQDKPLSLRALLTSRVIIAAGNYATLSLFDIAFRAVQPLFFATPISLGGLGLSPPEIGRILAVYGIVNGLFQVFCFADLHDRFGTKLIFEVGILCGIPAVATLPIINFLARSGEIGVTIWVMIVIQVACSIVLNLCYAAASPNRSSLGATNGIAQLLVSIMRAIGPAAATSAFSISIQKHLLGGWFVYYLLLAIVGGAFAASVFLPRKVWKREEES